MSLFDGVSAVHSSGQEVLPLLQDGGQGLPQEVPAIENCLNMVACDTASTSIRLISPLGTEKTL